MTDSMNTNNDLDSYGVWVKRSGNTNLPTPENQEPEISDLDLNSVAEEKQSFSPTTVEEQTSTMSVSSDNGISASADDAPFEISDEVIAVLDTPVSNDELENVSVSGVDTGKDMLDDNIELADFNEPSDLGFEEAPKAVEVMSKTNDAAVSVNSDLLQQIVADLAELKSEIAELKNNFAELQNKSTSDFDSGTPVSNDGGGFFSDDDEDETISLSGDELSNIMNSANFSGSDDDTSFADMGIIDNADEIASLDTESPYEEPQVEDPAAEEQAVEFVDNPVVEKPIVEEPIESIIEDNSGTDEIADMPDMEDLSVDVEKFEDTNEIDTGNVSIDDELKFEEESLDLPDLSDLSSLGTDMGFMADDDFPDEISVPKLDDVMVDSSDADFLDSVKETEIGVPEFDIPESLPDDALEPETLDETENVFEEESENLEDDFAIGDDHPAIAEMIAADPEIHESITDNHMDYLKTDENVTFEDDLPTESEEVAPSQEFEEGIEDISSDAENSEEEPRTFVDDLVETHEDETAIPVGLKNEIKSVLLYMDQLLESLPEEKIVEFAQSEQFNTYKKLFSDLGLS